MNSKQQLVENMISHLVKKRFPEVVFTMAFSSDHFYIQETPTLKNQEEKITLEKEAKSFWKKLETMEFDELGAFYNQEKEEEYQQALEADKYLFFHKPESKLRTHDFWANLPFWTHEQSTALSLGKEPNKVRGHSLSEYYNSPFVKTYNERKALFHQIIDLKANKEAGTKHLCPADIIKEAKLAGINFPKKLTQKVLKFHKASSAQEEIKKLRSENQELRNKITALEASQRDLQEEIAALKHQDKENTIHPKEKESMLKIIVGMAIKGYCYKPKASKNSAVKDIVNDISACELSCDSDTVRKFLKEACALLPSILLDE